MHETHIFVRVLIRVGSSGDEKHQQSGAKGPNSGKMARILANGIVQPIA